jgi:type II secretory pathway pseudopilin PulG
VIVAQRAVRQFQRPGPGCGAARRFAPAYTLIELLIVIAMLGLASAVVIPNMGSVDVLRVQSTVRAIVSDITYAQSEALARQSPRALVFDVANNRYSVVDVPGNAVDPVANTQYTVNLSDAQRFHDSRITGAEFDGVPVLIFDELGGPVTDPSGTTPSAGGSVTISGSGAVFRIDVEAYTGRVTVTRVSG